MLDDESNKMFISRTVKFFDEGAVSQEEHADVDISGPRVPEPRRNPNRAVKKVQPIPDLSAHYEKNRAKQELRRAKQQESRQNSEAREEDDPQEGTSRQEEHKIEWQDEGDSAPETYEQATTSIWKKLW